jgi:hypothetical protein
MPAPRKKGTGFSRAFLCAASAERAKNFFAALLFFLRASGRKPPIPALNQLPGAVSTAHPKLQVQACRSFSL